MKTKQTPVALAFNAAGLTVAPVAKDAKKPGPAHPPVADMVAACVTCFADFLSAGATLQNAKAEWDAARMGLREELARAHKVIAAGKPWDAFMRDLCTALASAGICKSAKDARKLALNQLAALKIIGKGERAGAGGKKRGPTKRRANFEYSVKDFARMLAFLRAEQEERTGDDLETLGMIVKVVNAAKRAK